MTIPELIAPASVEAFAIDLLAKIGESTPDLIYAKDLQSRMIFANRAVLDVLGKSWEEIRGRSDDQWHDDENEGRRFVDADARIMAGGETEELEEKLTGVDGTRIYLSSKSPLRAPDGTIIGIFGISKNITGRKNEERLRQILLNELDHRVKNTLGLVQAMARQTFRNVEIDRKIWDAFEGRLSSMAKAHGLLTRQSWAGAQIADVVAEGLVAHGGMQAGQFTVTGPEAWVDAQTSLALAMVLHELGTNAIKYGALSVPDGRVEISWNVTTTDGLQMIELHWVERDGPEVSVPTRKGFGSRMIDQALSSTAPCFSQIQYLPQGVECRFRIRLSERLTA